MLRQSLKHNSSLNRRSFCGAAVAVSISGAAEGGDTAGSPNNVLRGLLQGNQRFVAGDSNHPHFSKDWRRRLVGAQKPVATIIGCSDSRVPPELLFDQGFGDLFVVRVAGNVIDNDVIASVEYGVDHLKTGLVIVMGHEGCGAVTAALKSNLDKEPTEIRRLVRKIKPSVLNKDSFEESLRLSVESNVHASVAKLRSTLDLKIAESEQRTRIIGCVFELSTGIVRQLKESR